jgi:hypothetical protein
LSSIYPRPSGSGHPQVTVEGPNYFPVTLRDISEQQQAEITVKVAQEHFENIL